MKLVYLSPLNWTSFEQRPHKFVEWWQKRTGGDVLWVDPYPTRLPKLADFKRVSMKADEPPKVTPRWIQVLSSATFPIEPLPGSGWANGLVWRKLFHSIDQFTKGGEVTIGVGKPSELALQLIRRLKDANTFYDAMDDFPAFYSLLSRVSMERRERELVRNVNSVWVSSTKLKEKWVNVALKLSVVPNGVDEFILPKGNTCINKENQRVFGYVGTLGQWFDWEWVIQLAKLRPNDIVRLVGPLYVQRPTNLPCNIEIKPACAHREAIEEMKQFDVGLIPFKNTELTESVDPIKYYEYKSIGLPIVSTSFGEMTFRSDIDGVFICKLQDSLVDILNAALLHNEDKALTNRFRLENTWESRFDNIGLI